MVDVSRTDEDDEIGAPIEELDELLQDLAFEAANRLDWVAIVQQGFPALDEEQEQVLKDMGEAFAADQIVQRELDGETLTGEEHRWVAEITNRLAPRYEIDVPGSVTELIDSWGARTGPSRTFRRRRR